MTEKCCIQCSLCEHYMIILNAIQTLLQWDKEEKRIVIKIKMHKILFQSSYMQTSLYHSSRLVTNDIYKMAKDLQYFYLANAILCGNTGYVQNIYKPILFYKTSIKYVVY
jgi:hypothetical protein